MGFSDREIFRQVRDTKAVRRRRPDREQDHGPQRSFRRRCRSCAMASSAACAPSASRSATSPTRCCRSGPTAASRCRWSIAAAPRSAARAGMVRALPVATRIAAAIVGGQTTFRDYGQDGMLYAFSIRPLAGSAIFAVAAAPVPDELLSLARAADGLVLLMLALVMTLVAVWFGADRWCVRPLRYIRDFADKVAPRRAGRFWTATALDARTGVGRRGGDGDGRGDRQPGSRTEGRTRAARPHAARDSSPGEEQPADDFEPAQPAGRRNPLAAHPSLLRRCPEPRAHPLDPASPSL